MKHFIMIGLVLLLAGCDGFTSGKDIQIAIQACEMNGGLLYVSNTPMSESALSTIKCKNGFETTVTEYMRLNGIDK